MTYACENGHTDVADVLLQAGANLVCHESLLVRCPIVRTGVSFQKYVRALILLWSLVLLSYTFLSIICFLGARV